ncbi:MAG TPA: SMP-30/gluconolactonase/LRE family protein [Kofleriaceae bacterium]|nr:SMP-30/gluconolactonase/LRE family protein [Kofleriaceae bacterium]
MKRLPVAGLLLGILVAGCGGDGGGSEVDAAGGGGDGGEVDGAGGDGGGTDAGGDGASACGTMMPTLADLGGTEGIAIAGDGTIYYSQNGAVGRWVPGGQAVDQWVTLSGATTVWGMALDGDILYVGSPGSGGRIWRIDTAAATPAATTYYMTAGSANGVTVGPDGAVYYSDFNATGHVWRVTGVGVRTQVTTTAINQPNGVMFDADGTLLVARYANPSEIYRLTLTAGAETGRITALSNTAGMVGNPDGLARDEMGRLYVTNNSGGRVLRFGAAMNGVFGAREELAMSVGSAANMAFGRGALACTDLYVTSSGALRKLAVGATGVP